MTTVRHRIRVKKNSFEKEIWLKNGFLCGLDEVGRGCLAGPVVTAAVILKPNKKSLLIKDSKILTPEEREIAFKWILKNGWVGIAPIHHRLVDEKNLHFATLIAMKRAFLQSVAACPHKPSLVITDNMPLDLGHTAYADVPVYYFPHSEKVSISIAAASIVAKVTRDHLMERLESVIPGYGLDQHKGYRTPFHKKQLATIGSSIIHRQRFVEQMLNWYYKGVEEDGEQQSGEGFGQQQTLC